PPGYRPGTGVRLPSGCRQGEGRGSRTSRTLSKVEEEYAAYDVSSEEQGLRKHGGGRPPSVGQDLARRGLDAEGRGCGDKTECSALRKGIAQRRGEEAEVRGCCDECEPDEEEGNSGGRDAAARRCGVPRPEHGDGCDDWREAGDTDE